MLHTTNKQLNYSLATPSSPYSSYSSSSSVVSSHVQTKCNKRNTSTNNASNDVNSQVSTSRERKAAKRKEKSRVAAQIRRNKESQTLILLQNALPISLASPSVMLEKSIVIRISGQTLFLLNNLDQVLGTKSLVTTHLKSHNFLGIFMNSQGQIVYVTPSIQNKIEQYHWSNLVGLPLHEVIEIQEEVSRSSPNLAHSKSPYSKLYNHNHHRNTSHFSFQSNHNHHHCSNLPKPGDVVKLKLSSPITSSSNSFFPTLSSHASSDIAPIPRTSNPSNIRVQRSQSFSSSLSNLSLSSPGKSSLFLPFSPSLSGHTSLSTTKHKPTSSSSFLSSSSNKLFKTPGSSSHSLNPLQISNNSFSSSSNATGGINNSKSLLALKLGNSQSKMLRNAYSICSLYTVWCSCDIIHTNSNLHLILLQPLNPTQPSPSTTTIPSPSSSMSSPGCGYSSSSFDCSNTNKHPTLSRSNSVSNSNSQHYQQNRYYHHSQYYHQVTSVLDNNYNFEYISSEFSNLTGLDQQSMKSMNFLELVNINDVISIKSVFDKVSNKHKNQAWTPVYRIQKPNGTFCLLRTLVKQNLLSQVSNSSNPMTNLSSTTSSSSSPLSSNPDQDLLLLSHTIIRISNKLPKSMKDKSKTFISKSISDFITKEEFDDFDEKTFISGSSQGSMHPRETDSFNALLNGSSHLSAQHTYESYHRKFIEADVDDDSDDNKDKVVNRKDKLAVVSRNFKKENICPTSSSSSSKASAFSLKRKSLEKSVYPCKLRSQSFINQIPEEQDDPLIFTAYSMNDENYNVKYSKTSTSQLKLTNSLNHRSNKSPINLENNDAESISVSFGLDDSDNTNINSRVNNCTSINNCDTSTMSNSSDDLNIHFDDVITQSHMSPLLGHSYWDDDYESQIDLLL